MGFAVDISDVPVEIQSVPNGNYLAEVKTAKYGVTAKGDPSIKLVFRIEGDFGVAEVFDSLPSSFPAKCRSFYAAFNNLSPQDMAGMKTLEIEPDELIGGTIIIAFGESERNGTTYKQLVSPWYYPDTRHDVLSDADAPF